MNREVERRSVPFFEAVLAAIAALSFPSSLQAQESQVLQPAVSIERYVEPIGKTDFLSLPASRILTQKQWSFSLLTTLSSRPARLKSLSGDRVAVDAVRVRLGLEPTFALGVGKGLQFGIGVPLVLAQDGRRLQGVGASERSLAPYALGDIRVGGALQIHGGPRFYSALHFEGRTPTGDEENFAGDKGASLLAHWALSWHLASVTLGASIGYRVRMQRVVFLSPARPHGNELLACLAARYPAKSVEPQPAFLGVSFAIAELALVRGIDGGHSPQELRLGVGRRLTGLIEAVFSLGTALDGESLGAPQWRASASLRRPWSID